MQAAVKIFSTVKNPKENNKPPSGIGNNEPGEGNNKLLSGYGDKGEVNAARLTFLSENNSDKFDDLFKVSCNTYGKVTRKSCSTKNPEKKKKFIIDVSNL